MRPIVGWYPQPDPRLLKRFSANQLEQARRGSVDERPPHSVIIPLRSEQASREQQGQRLRAVTGQRDGPPGPIDSSAAPLTSSIRRRVAMPSMITMARTSACSWVSRGQLLRLDQLGDRRVEALLGRQLDMSAVVEDLHARHLQLLGQPAQPKPDVSDRDRPCYCRRASRPSGSSEH